MTWDHITTAADAVLYVAVLAIAYAVLLRFRVLSPAARGRFARAFVALSVVGVAWAAYDNTGIRETEYAMLWKAYEIAQPERQAAMREIAIRAGARRDIYSMAHSQRDRYLHAGGYCRWMLEPSCAPTPVTTEHWLEGREAMARGMRTYAESLGDCDPRRCSWMVDGR